MTTSLFAIGTPGLREMLLMLLPLAIAYGIYRLVMRAAKK